MLHTQTVILLSMRLTESMTHISDNRFTKALTQTYYRFTNALTQN